MKSQIILTLILHTLFCFGQEQNIEMTRIGTISIISQVGEKESFTYLKKNGKNELKIIFNKKNLLAKIQENIDGLEKEQIFYFRRLELFSLIKNSSCLINSKIEDIEFTNFFDLLLNDFIENDKVEIYLNNERINELVLYKREESYYERSENPFENYASYYTYHVFKTKSGKEVLSVLLYGSEE